MQTRGYFLSQNNFFKKPKNIILVDKYFMTLLYRLCYFKFSIKYILFILAVFCTCFLLMLASYITLLYNNKSYILKYILDLLATIKFIKFFS